MERTDERMIQTDVCEKVKKGETDRERISEGWVEKKSE